MSEATSSEQMRSSPVQKDWVQFDEAEEAAASAGTVTTLQYSGAVIDTETVQVDVEKVKQQVQLPKSETLEVLDGSAAGGARSPIGELMTNIHLDEPGNGSISHTVVLHSAPSVHRGFSNGDIIVTVLPVNHAWPWVTAAQFRPELVPEELMAAGLSLTVEEYVQIVETLVHDVRFTMYNVCYKRLLLAWLLTSFIILLAILFSGAKGIGLFGCGVVWLIINAGAIFLCMWMKNKMNRGLERAVAKANRTLARHRILLGVDDRGKLSCHKIMLCFIYFDVSDCVRRLHQVIETEEAPNTSNGEIQEQRRLRDLQLRMDIDDGDIVVAGANTTRISRKQERSRMLLLRYSQRWAKEYLRQNIDLQLVAASISTITGGEQCAASSVLATSCLQLHSAKSQCLCQYVELHLFKKANMEAGALKTY